MCEEKDINEWMYEKCINNLISKKRYNYTNRVNKNK